MQYIIELNGVDIYGTALNVKFIIRVLIVLIRLRMTDNIIYLYFITNTKLVNNIYY